MTLSAVAPVPLQIQLDASFTRSGAAAQTQSPNISPMKAFSARPSRASRHKHVAREAFPVSIGSWRQKSLYPTSSRRAGSAKRTCQYASFAAKNAAFVRVDIGVGDIRDVVTLPFGERDEIAIVREKVSGALAAVVRPIEGDGKRMPR